jgi:hypothetical protein
MATWVEQAVTVIEQLERATGSTTLPAEREAAIEAAGAAYQLADELDIRRLLLAAEAPSDQTLGEKWEQLAQADADYAAALRLSWPALDQILTGYLAVKTRQKVMAARATRLEALYNRLFTTFDNDVAQGRLPAADTSNTIRDAYYQDTRDFNREYRDLAAEIGQIATPEQDVLWLDKLLEETARHDLAAALQTLAETAAIPKPVNKKAILKGYQAYALAYVQELAAGGRPRWPDELREAQAIIARLPFSAERDEAKQKLDAWERQLAELRRQLGWEAGQGWEVFRDHVINVADPRGEGDGIELALHEAVKKRIEVWERPRRTEHPDLPPLEDELNGYRAGTLLITRTWQQFPGQLEALAEQLRGYATNLAGIEGYAERLAELRTTLGRFNRLLDQVEEVASRLSRTQELVEQYQQAEAVVRQYQQVEAEWAGSRQAAADILKTSEVLLSRLAAVRQEIDATGASTSELIHEYRAFLERLQAPAEQPNEALGLHWIIWGLDAANLLQPALAKDCLVKAERLLHNAHDKTVQASLQQLRLAASWLEMMEQRYKSSGWPLLQAYHKAVRNSDRPAADLAWASLKKESAELLNGFISRQLRQEHRLLVAQAAAAVPLNVLESHSTAPAPEPSEPAARRPSTSAAPPPLSSSPRIETKQPAPGDTTALPSLEQELKRIENEWDGILLLLPGWLNEGTNVGKWNRLIDGTDALARRAKTDLQLLKRLQEKIAAVERRKPSTNPHPGWATLRLLQEILRVLLADAESANSPAAAIATGTRLRPPSPLTVAETRRPVPAAKIESSILFREWDDIIPLLPAWLDDRSNEAVWNELIDKSAALAAQAAGDLALLRKLQEKIDLVASKRPAMNPHPGWAVLKFFQARIRSIRASAAA